MRISVFVDSAFTAMAEYNADDVTALLQRTQHNSSSIDNRQLADLSREQTDLLILPYLEGEFSEKSLAALIEFHAAGGSLLFLGDLPHRERWYPLRNMHASDFHLNRCQDGVRITGLTESGKNIVGELQDPEFFTGRSFSGLRVTAYPPDITHPLLAVESSAHNVISESVVCVERKGEKFFGARLAAVGFIGGEPRENVCGVYQRKWTYDPGLLTRDWKGIDPLVESLIRWLEPQQIAGAVDCISVHVADEPSPVSFRLRNLTNQPVTLDKVQLHGSGKVLHEQSMELAGCATSQIPTEIVAPEFGIYPYQLTAELNGEEAFLAEATERVLDADSSKQCGFGYSTFWSFQKPVVSQPYKVFAREMKKRGCQYLRANVPWEDIEPEPGAYNWSVPDQLAELAEKENLQLLYWMFPTTRGSGLGECGIPEWTLKEPAIDRDGNPGLFPTLWSPFYRKHYFDMIAAFTSRYANHEAVKSFVLDFGNSDFPYGYYYYVNDSTLFDYSEIEQRAWQRYLVEQRGFDLEAIGQFFNRSFAELAEVPVPLAARDPEAWRMYLDFRAWSIHQGIKTCFDVCRENAPEKMPADLPGHGLGSIADLCAYHYEAKARHWWEEKKFDPKYTELHNAGAEWGGEAWQVGGDFRQYDDALFGSVRLNATYYTIPGPDLGVFGEDIARSGFIRRSIMGATRREPELAVIGELTWQNMNALTNIASRLDQGTALLSKTHRYDFSCHKLLVLPEDELLTTSATIGTGGSLLPVDQGWYWLVRECVEKGMHLLVFPDSCQAGRTPLPLTFLRQVCGCEDISYGEERDCTVELPTSFGGGTISGRCRSVSGDGDSLLSDGETVLLQRHLGKGSILFAGYNSSPESFDCFGPSLESHTLNRLCLHLGIAPREIDTAQTAVFKEMVHWNGRDFLLLYSHLQETVDISIRVCLTSPAQQAIELATGETFSVAPETDGWFSLSVPVVPREGRYISFR